jgi:hypothetical protein
MSCMGDFLFYILFVLLCYRVVGYCEETGKKSTNIIKKRMEELRGSNNE